MADTSDKNRKARSPVIDWATERYGRWALLALGVVTIGGTALLLATFETAPISVSGAASSDLAAAADIVRSMVGIAIGTGLTSLALVEVMKRVTSIRGWFHKREVRAYLESAPAFPRPTVGNSHSAWDDLMDLLGEVWLGKRVLVNKRLAVPGGRLDRILKARDQRDLRYFFDLPLERLFGQMGAAVEVALTTPDRSLDLLYCLAGDGALQDLENLQYPPEHVDSPELDVRVRAQAIVSERAQRGLDSLQIIIGHRWRWFVRATAILWCGVVALLLLELARTPKVAAMFTWVFAVVMGSLFAWIGRDLAAAAERWRR